VPDRPGVLAEVTATMSDAGVNIEDLPDRPFARGGPGTVHLTLAADAAHDAELALRKRRFEPQRLA
jgi:glycine cleavage system regulatory protein